VTLGEKTNGPEDDLRPSKAIRRHERQQPASGERSIGGRAWRLAQGTLQTKLAESGVLRL
jgi:hypothetical protein